MTDIKHASPPPDDRNADRLPPDPEFANVLRSFVGANRKLLVWVPERPLDQFIAFRDAVLDAAQSEEVISETAAALTAAHGDPQTAHAVHLIVLELRAFSSAVDVATAPSTPPATAEGPRLPLWKRLLRVGVRRLTACGRFSSGSSASAGRRSGSSYQRSLKSSAATDQPGLRDQPDRPQESVLEKVYWRLTTHLTRGPHSDAGHITSSFSNTLKKQESTIANPFDALVCDGVSASVQLIDPGTGSI